jgi:hypothetical protein
MSPQSDPTDYDDTWDEDDPDAPQARDLRGEDDDETPTVPCPNCRRAVPDFADRCPYCGDWIVQGTGAPARTKPWFIIALIIALTVFVAWYVF